MRLSPFFFVLILLAPAAWSQEATSTPGTPNPESTVGTPSAPTTEGGETDEAKEPFKPSWSEVLSFSYSGQPAPSGGGQLTRELSFSSTKTLSEGGDSFTLGVAGGEQVVEGAISNYGKLTVGGGLGMGFCSPSLTFDGQKGESALNSLDGSLNVSVPIYSALSLELEGGGNVESHQGPVSAVLGTSDVIDQIDNWGWSFGLASTFQAFDFLSATLTASRAFSQTFQFENLSRTSVTSLNNNVSRTDSLELELAFSFNGPEIELSGELGQEFDPAGTLYSPTLGRTVNFSKPTTQPITGYTLAFLYNFE